LLPDCIFNDPLLNILDADLRISAFAKLKLANRTPIPGLPAIGFFMRQSVRAPARKPRRVFSCPAQQIWSKQMMYQKGQSGNPAGRPPGSRNKATMLAEAMFQGEAETIIRMAIDKAKAGDITAIRLCLERVFPRLRDRPTVFDLPPINGAPEALAALTTIVAGVRDGDLTAAEAGDLSKLVDHYLRALEAKDFEQRLHMLASSSPKDETSDAS
jgi:hypothetical protein